MKTKRISAVSAILLIAVTGCGPEADKQQVAPPKKAATTAPVSAVQHGKGDGTIAVVGPGNMVTLDHGEIAALKWPPMTMGFEASSDLLNGLRVGDRVGFEFDWDGAKGSITRIEAMPAL